MFNILNFVHDLPLFNCWVDIWCLCASTKSSHDIVMVHLRSVCILIKCCQSTSVHGFNLRLTRMWFIACLEKLCCCFFVIMLPICAYLLVNCYTDELIQGNLVIWLFLTVVVRYGRYCRNQWCGLRPSVFRTGPVWDKKIGLGLGVAGLVLFCETWYCHARRHNDLEGHSNFQVLFIVYIFCAWNITTVEVNSGVHLLKS